MILDVIQTSKELFAANFIVNRGNMQVGTFELKGGLGTMEVRVHGTIFEQVIDMTFGKTDDIEVSHPFRAYQIYKNGIYNGVVYQTTSDERWFKKYGYHQMKKSGVTYNMFPVGLGKNGIKSPIFQDNSQIAQVEKDCVVYNDLHIYKIFARDEFTSEIAVLFTIYYYINVNYKAGEKTITSTYKTISKTTNKLLLKKYNSEFTKYIEE